jgi:hypothetical protein
VKAEQNMSALHSNGGGNGSGGSALIEKVKGGSYLDAQWGRLSQSDKDCIMKYRGGVTEKEKEESASQPEEEACKSQVGA